MVEQYLLLTITLLFAGLVSVTIVAITLIIVLIHILGKKTKNTHSACRLECVFKIIQPATTSCGSLFLFLLYHNF